MRTPQEIPILPLSINLDLNFKNNVEGTLENFRDAIYTNALNLAGEYDPATAYKYNYMVKYNGELYICIKDCTGIAPGDTEYWDKVTDKGKSLEWKGSYDNGAAYKILDLVFYEANVYICIQNSTGHAPSDTAYWKMLSHGIVWKGEFNISTIYNLNEAVSYQGSSYLCIKQSTGILPTSTTYWACLAQKGQDGTGGDMYKSVYDADDDGHIDELVEYKAENVSEFGKRPPISIFDDMPTPEELEEGEIGLYPDTSPEYSEGDWSPGLTGSVSAGTTIGVTSAGKYVKIGKLVWVLGYLRANDIDIEGDVRITGFPFVAANSGTGTVGGNGHLLTTLVANAGSTDIVVSVIGETNYAVLYKSSANSLPAIVQASELPQGTQASSARFNIRFTGFYLAE